MKYITLLLALLISTISFAEDKKIYTEKEFKEKVDEQLKKRMSDIKKKSVVELARELVDKESSLNKKEEALVKKDEQISVASKQLEGRIVDFETRQKTILGCIKKNEDSVNQRVSQVVKMISGMRPAKAAAVLSVQESNISVKILSRIDPTKASKIFNVMEKEVSARLQKEYLNMKQ